MRSHASAPALWGAEVDYSQEHVLPWGRRLKEVLGEKWPNVFILPSGGSQNTHSRSCSDVSFTGTSVTLTRCLLMSVRPSHVGLQNPFLVTPGSLCDPRCSPSVAPGAPDQFQYPG